MRDVMAFVLIIAALFALAYRVDAKKKEDKARKFQDCIADIHNVHYCETEAQ